MRRTSKPRVVWLPPDDTNSLTLSTLTGYQQAVVNVTGADPVGVNEIPLTIDAKADITTASLSDVENSGYRLRRIVGKIWTFADAFDDESGIETVIVTAGIIVRRVSDDGINSLASTSNSLLIHPGQAQNWSDPWIWRRSWILQNPQVTPLNGVLPFSNLEIGSGIADGPHVDQKTARLVSQEERLYLDLGVTAVFGSGAGELNNTTTFLVDLRCLGSMRTSTGNRRNASR